MKLNKIIAGDRYIAGNIEFHKELINKIDLILFVDSGKIVLVGKCFSQEDWLIDGGVGLYYDTPVNIPVRFDVGYNFRDGGYNINIGYGHTY